MLNERRSFEDMLVSWGHFCVLRKIELDKPLSTWYESFYDEASRSAVRELTSGRPYTDHLVRMTKRTVWPGFDRRTEAGVVSSPGVYFYLSTSTKRTKHDLILELAQTETNGKVVPISPFKVIRAYFVMDPEELRMTNGKIGYFRVRVEESNLGGIN